METTTSLQPLRSFKEQFNYAPMIIGTTTLTYDGVIVCGMGGSLIASKMILLLFPDLPIAFHNSYGVPRTTEFQNPLFVLSSYSGNTEEVLDAYEHTQKHSLPSFVITTGGILLDNARRDNVPHIMLPNDTHLEPRFSIGYQMIALLEIMEQHSKINDLRHAASLVSIEECEKLAVTLLTQFNEKSLVIYSSQLLHPLSYTMKAAINEGAKVPAFTSLVPEANHNELQSFVKDEQNTYTSSFGFIFFVSPYDHTRIQKRMETMKAIYEEMSFTCELFIIDETKGSQILSMLYTGYAYATLLANKRNVDPYTTPLIQAFKQKLL
jgi:glucose/mannose-6-phosphate isomerase